MINTNYIKLKTRLIGALHNAIKKDPDVDKEMLEKAFKEACQKLVRKGVLPVKF